MARLGTTLMAIIGAGGLLLASSAMAAPEDTPSGQSVTTQTRVRSGAQVGDAGAAAGQRGAGHVRRLGPGDASGNQGVKPNDGTGFGSPGHLGGSDGEGSRAGSSATSRKGTSNGGAGVGSRSRVRTPGSSGATGTCTGAGARSGARGGGSRSRR